MRKLLFGLIVLFSVAAVASAQTGEAVKLDEMKFNPCDFLQGYLDSFFSQITNNSETAKGYIIVYEGKIPSFKRALRTVNPPRGFAKSWIQTVRNHMKFRTISDEQIVFIEGGFRTDFTTEFWLVPNNANPPKASPTLEKIKYRKNRATNICKGL